MLEAPAPSQVELFESICKKLRFKYRPEDFVNPMLATFYSNLEALVYDEEAQEVNDLTLPPYEKQDTKIQKFVDHIEEEFGAVS